MVAQTSSSVGPQGWGAPGYSSPTAQHGKSAPSICAGPCGALSVRGSVGRRPHKRRAGTPGLQVWWAEAGRAERVHQSPGEAPGVAGGGGGVGRLPRSEWCLGGGRAGAAGRVLQAGAPRERRALGSVPVRGCGAGSRAPGTTRACRGHPFFGCSTSWGWGRHCCRGTAARGPLHTDWRGEGSPAAKVRGHSAAAAWGAQGSVAAAQPCLLAPSSPPLSPRPREREFRERP